MSSSWCLQSYLIIIFNILHIVWTVPPNYCLAPFNHSDCRLPPQYVFAYYKPGSRCELEVWRGCPTLNKFENEYLCSMNCIFRSGNAIAPLSGTDECALTLNTEKCNDETQTVYTHVDGRCIKAEWGGCQTFNKFDSKTECVATCHAGNNEPNSGMEDDIVKDLNKLLKYIINKTNTTRNATNATATDPPGATNATATNNTGATNPTTTTTEPGNATNPTPTNTGGTTATEPGDATNTAGTTVTEPGDATNTAATTVTEPGDATNAAGTTDAVPGDTTNTADTTPST